MATCDVRGIVQSTSNQISAMGRTAPISFGALPDSLTKCRQSHFSLFGQLQGIINLDAEVAYGALELGVPKQ